MNPKGNKNRGTNSKFLGMALVATTKTGNKMLQVFLALPFLMNCSFLSGKGGLGENQIAVISDRLYTHTKEENTKEQEKLYTENLGGKNLSLLKCLNFFLLHNKCS